MLCYSACSHECVGCRCTRRTGVGVVWRHTLHLCGQVPDRGGSFDARFHRNSDLEGGRVATQHARAHGHHFERAPEVHGGAAGGRAVALSPAGRAARGEARAGAPRGRGAARRSALKNTAALLKAHRAFVAGGAVPRSAGKWA